MLVLILYLLLKEISMSEEPKHLFEIKAFIDDSAQITTLSNKAADFLFGVTIYSGYYEQGFRVWKILLKKDIINKHLNANLINHFYIYIVVKKTSGSNVVYTNVEGRTIFFY